MSERLTDAECAEMERLEKAATPGPWRLDAEVGKIGSGLVGDTQRVSALGDFYANNLLGADARFIAAARNALPGGTMQEAARLLREMAGDLVQLDLTWSIGRPDDAWRESVLARWKLPKWPYRT